MNKVSFFVLGCVSILLSIFLFSCAKEGMPQGGPLDTIPPKLKWSVPPQFAKNFHGKKIIFRFDEYFDLKNINQEFFSSPPFARQPKFVISGKKLIVHLRDSLRDSATYTLDFGNSIVDYHEGNVLKGFKYVFSTYNQIDTLQIPGRIIDAFTLEPVAGAYIMLYRQLGDSVVYLHPPQYIARSDDSGRFVLFGLKQGRYKVFALMDLNNDFIYDGIENQIAFLDSTVSPRVEVKVFHDTLPANTVLHDTINNITDTLKHDTVIVRRVVKYYPFLNLFMFKENTRPQQIVSTARPYPFLVTVRFNLPLIDNFYRLKCLTNGFDSTDYLPEYFVNSDSLWIWIIDSIMQQQDTLQFAFDLFTPVKDGKQLITDTATAFLPVDSLAKFKISVLNKKPNFFDSVVLQANQYLLKFDTSRTDLVQIVDTSVYDTKNVKVACLRVEPNEIQVIFSKPVDTQRVNFVILNASKEQYTYSFSPDSQVLNIKLSNTLSDLDTIPIDLFYRVKRFYPYYEPFRCKQKLTLVRQQLVKTIWNEPRQLKLLFIKPVKKLQIKGLDYDSLRVDLRTVTIYLKNFQDSLSFRVEMLDFSGLTVHPVYYSKEITVKFNYPKNKIIRYAHTSRDTIKLEFKTRIDSLLYLKPVDYNKPNWGQIAVNGNLAIIRLLDKKLKRLKFLKLAYAVQQHIGDSLCTTIDTLQITYGTDQFLQKTTTMKPIQFRMLQDSVNYEKFYVYAKLQPGRKYELLFYPETFTTISRQTIDTLTQLQFMTNSQKDYGDAILDIVDTLGTLTNMQLILSLMDGKNNLIKQKIVSDTGKVYFYRLPKGNYKLRIIFDKNKNGRWDTGNYLRDEQPEKIIIYPQPIIVKPNWQMEQRIIIN